MSGGVVVSVGLVGGGMLVSGGGGVVSVEGAGAGIGAVSSIVSSDLQAASDRLPATPMARSVLRRMAFMDRMTSYVKEPLNRRPSLRREELTQALPRVTTQRRFNHAAEGTV